MATPSLGSTTKRYYFLVPALSYVARGLLERILNFEYGDVDTLHIMPTYIIQIIKAQALKSERIDSSQRLAHITHKTVRQNRTKHTTTHKHSHTVKKAKQNPLQHPKNRLY